MSARQSAATDQGTTMKRSNMMTTQADVRNAFWLTFCVEGKPREYWGKSQNELPTDVRVAFVDFVDYLSREGTITESLAARVTL